MHRVASADQVQRALPACFHTNRSARMHLQTLAAAGELTVVRSRGIGGVNMYIITQRGLRAIAPGSESSVPRRRHPSGTHLAHELLTTEFAVRLIESQRRLPAMRVPWEERFGFPTYGCFRGLVPDFAFLAKNPRGHLVHFVEVSSGEDSTTRLRDKLLSYALWAEAAESQRFLIELYREQGAAQPKPHFRILFLLHHRLGLGDNIRTRQLLQAAADAPTHLRRRLWYTTANDMAASTALLDPIWSRVGDVEPVYQEQAVLRRHEFHQRLAGVQRATPRHALVPNEATA